MAFRSFSEIYCDTAKRSEKPKTLYVSRRVTNADEIIAWAKSQGFKKCVPPEEMHVTIVYSQDPLVWDSIGDSVDNLEFKSGNREISPLGDDGAVVLKFEARELHDRWQQARDAGASWDYPSYQPHVTLTYSDPEIDIEAIEPFDGTIKFGPERFEEINDDWAAGIVEKLKDTEWNYDKRLGIVFGWGIICKENGVDHYDYQGDHIPEDVMLEAVTDFMENARVAKEMHIGDMKGIIVHSMAWTTDVAKSFTGMEPDKTGWMIAMKPSDPKILEKFDTKEYRGFSIGGKGEFIEE